MKHIADWTVSENKRLSADFCLLKVRLNDELPEIVPGQFVQILVPNAPNTLLRRPISVHFVDYDTHELWLLVQLVGAGTKKLSELKVGEQLNIVFPLGNGFSLPSAPSSRGGGEAITPPLEAGGGGRLLLIGGGAGTAPLLYLGKQLKELGHQPLFLLGGRTVNHLLQLAEFEKYGEVHTTTEDGSHGEKGFVTNHTILQTFAISSQRGVMSTGTPAACSGDTPSTIAQIYVCGPKPMMQAVAKYAKQHTIPCEVSLENKMACGIGACLCCVEKTTYGNICVCTAGPVFNINQLTWQI
ncbi:MAG: dihydroorotate dehydrogenase electron transfer subunit [Candidatus Symbiothrix sp.]|jgi:dihydroorotate dehydrogenase electron transfer subunit|nr:dihydroorotate dehydrogenase electron transfer subunit [Candidatus Symbiothrix sp.]